LVEAGVSKSGKPKKSPTPNASTRNNIFDLSKLNSKLPSGKLDVPHVLLSVALEEDQSLDPDSWVNWMSDLPALAKYVLVEGVFRSHSTMILVSLPVPIWDVLRDDLAISFIGYVEYEPFFRILNGLAILWTFMPGSSLPNVPPVVRYK
jgi:hypothetical protein